MTDQFPIEQSVAVGPADDRRLVSAPTPRRAGAERRIRRAGSDPPLSDDWVLPEIDGLQNRYGSSLLDEFVLATRHPTL
jgi:hypothetical protein